MRDNSSAPAIWRRIHAALRDEIEAGAFKIGDRLPTEAQLSERFSVNRHTVRRALAELTAHGLIVTRRGSGAYVAEGVLEYPLAPGGRFAEVVSALGRVPDHRISDPVEGPAREPAAAHLDLGQRDRVIEVEVLSSVDGLPVATSQHVFPMPRFRDIAEALQARQSLAGAMAALGVRGYRRRWTRVAAQIAPPQMARRLNEPEGRPVLRTEWLGVDGDDRPVEFAVCCWSSARVRLIV
ncbi:MAG: phosphonate metabolism transcriptional regulator PhnF [Rubrimonas sp.]